MPSVGGEWKCDSGGSPEDIHMGNQWVEKHQGGVVCVFCVCVVSNMNDAQWHRKCSEVRWSRRAEDAVCSRDNLQLKFSALSGAVSGGDAHYGTIADTF